MRPSKIVYVQLTQPCRRPAVFVKRVICLEAYLRGSFAYQLTYELAFERDG